jgi:transcriptional antiterminator RfaH
MDTNMDISIALVNHNTGQSFDTASGSIPSAWYVVHCRAQQQLRAEENLVNQGYQCFLPVIQVERIKRGKRVVLTEPLFPNYLFIYLNRIDDNWAPIRSTRGVLRVVSFGGQPIALETGWVDHLRQRLETTTCTAALKHGDHVSVNIGSYTGIDAIFQAFDGEERIIILLNLLNQPQQIKVALSSVRKIEAPSLSV